MDHHGSQMDRSWSVAVTACVAAFFTVVMMTNSGFIYVSLIEEFDVDRETASWPASTLSIVAHSTGLLVSLGQRHLSIFEMGMAGSVFLWAGILGAVFAPDMTWMTLTLGLIHGFGVGVVCINMIIVVIMYFDKYRGIASGMKFAGYSLCSLLYPIILTSLKNAYGFRGALLVCTALTMNVTALSLLLKEPAWQTDHRSSRCENTNRVIENSTSSNTSDSCKEAVSAPRVFLEASVRILQESVQPSVTPEFLLVAKMGDLQRNQIDQGAASSSTSSNEGRAVSARGTLLSQTSMSRSPVALCTIDGVPDNNRRTDLLANDASVCTEKMAQYSAAVTNTENAVGQCLVGPSRRITLFHQILEVLAAPKFYAVLVAVVAIDYTMAVFPATIVDYALDKGSERRHADLSVAYCAPAGILGRIALPLIADCGLVTRTTLVSTSSFLLSGTFLLLPYTSSFISYIIVCACSTMFLGCLTSVKPVVIADYFGIDAVAAAWGFAAIMLLPLLLCSPAITGYFRDTKGSYDGLYQLQAGLQAFVGAVFGILAVLHCIHQNKRQSNSLC